MSGTYRRKLRGFLRWMEEKGIRYSEALDLTVKQHDDDDDSNGGRATAGRRRRSSSKGSSKGSSLGHGSVVHGVGVKALRDLKEGEVIGTIPKAACITVKTTGAAEAIEEAELGGGLGLAVALMYERARGEASPWYPYLQILPTRLDDLPIVWTPQDVDQLLTGTELHQAVLEDKKLIEEDWEECILPLCEKNPQDFPAVHFTLEDYFLAKTLISSRAFEVDEFHGYGMVPLADLFNHKTGAEDVHISDLGHDSDSEPDSDSDSASDSDSGSTMEPMGRSSRSKRANGFVGPKNSKVVAELESIEDRTGVLEIILVQNVSTGSEIFNTYGKLGNAGLLHRYGFTEPENPYDIVNIDYSLVMEYCMEVFSERHVRNRVRLWRRYGCMPCFSQESQYFEVSASGKPDLELLFCLYIVHLSDREFNAIDMSLTRFEIGEGSKDEDIHWTDKFAWCTKTTHATEGQKKLRGMHKTVNMQEAANVSAEGDRDLYQEFLTPEVCKALLWLCNRRDELYGTSSSVEEDMEKMGEVPKNIDGSRRYNALSLRVCERTILRRLNLLASERITALQDS